jgi:hypothetical protein
MIVVFLQNAWSPYYAGRTWPRSRWLLALERSRSGQRLKLLVDDLDQCENTTPIVGPTPSSVVLPDEEHILEILRRRQPTIVVACGRQAEDVLTRLWNGPLLALPHPASRTLTNELYNKARGWLDSRVYVTHDIPGRYALRQERNCSKQEILV